MIDETKLNYFEINNIFIFKMFEYLTEKTNTIWSLFDNASSIGTEFGCIYHFPVYIIFYTENDKKQMSWLNEWDARTAIRSVSKINGSAHINNIDDILSFFGDDLIKINIPIKLIKNIYNKCNTLDSKPNIYKPFYQLIFTYYLKNR